MIENLVWLAMCIYFEAMGEPKAGQVAVGHVIMNRVEKSGQSVKWIIKKPYQFSWLNNNTRPAIQNYDAFIKCVHSAYVCLEERMNGKDLWGADHFYNPDKANPAWGKVFQEIIVIGGHRFMKS